MLYERLADLVAARKKQAENALGHVALTSGFSDGNADQFRRARVSGVAIDDDGTAGRKCRRRVTTRDGICERKIARTENSNRTHRPKHRPEVGLWNWLAIGNCVVDARVDPRPFVQLIGEYPKLAA